MATHDYIISNASGAAVRADLNNALAAIATNNSSATEPTTTYAYQWWADTGSTPTVMKLRNAANSAWITLFQLDGEWSLIPFENGTAAAPSIYFKDSGTDTGFYSPGVDQVGITTGGVARLTTSTTAFTGTLPWQGQNGTAAAPALSFSGDPNSGVYNVGADDVGISTNGTLRFDVSTTATTSTLPVVHPLGAVGTPSVTFTGDLNTGVFSPGADSVAITTGGTARATVDSSGRLLVGTTSARANFYNTTFAPSIQLEGTNSVNSTLSLVSNSTSAAQFDQPTFVLGRSGGTTIGSNTIVAVNNAVGSVSFQGHDGSEFVPLAEIVAFVDATPGANDMPGRLVFSTTADGASNPVERCRIDSSGRLLVGTGSSTATARAVLQGNSADSTAASYLLMQRGQAAGASIPAATLLGIIRFCDNAGNAFSQILSEADAASGTNDYPGNLRFETTADGASSPTERMRIDSAGRVMIGATSFAGKGLSLQPNGGMISDNNGTITFTHLEIKNNNGSVGSIQSNGSSTSYNTSSDYRLKENIEPVVDGITRLQQLKPSRFNFIADPDKTVDGFIAHEVQGVVPEAINGEKDAEDEDGNPVYQGIDQSKLVPLLTAALQEAIAKIETLEAKVAALEAN